MSEFVVHTIADALNYKRPTLVVIKDGVLSFVDQGYEIDMTRIRGRASIIRWTHHLIGKSWMTLEIIEQFLELACAYRDIPVYGED